MNTDTKCSATLCDNSAVSFYQFGNDFYYCFCQTHDNNPSVHLSQQVFWYLGQDAQEFVSHIKLTKDEYVIAKIMES